MKIRIDRNFGSQLLPAMRKCGYSPLHNSGGEQNFTRRLGSLDYPHFHVYVNEASERGTILSLHLDQKKPSYGRQTAHSGDYDTAEVEREAARIKYVLNNI
jgi:hypothetical protein